MYNYKVITEEKEEFRLNADAFEFRDQWLIFFVFSKETLNNEEKKIGSSVWSFRAADVVRVEIES